VRGLVFNNVAYAEYIRIRAQGERNMMQTSCEVSYQEAAIPEPLAACCDGLQGKRVWSWGFVAMLAWGRLE